MSEPTLLTRVTSDFRVNVYFTTARYAHFGDFGCGILLEGSEERYCEFWQVCFWTWSDMVKDCI